MLEKFTTKQIKTSGAKINAKDKDGDTPLHAAAKKNLLDAAGLLIEKGAKVNVRSENGSTPLHRATDDDSVEVARLLIEKGAQINAKDEDGDLSLIPI